MVRAAQLAAVVIALVFILSAAGYGITRGLLSEGSRSEALPLHGLGGDKLPSNPGGAFVVVATRDVPGGARIGPDMVTMAEVPKEQAAPYAYNNVSAVVGQDAACDIEAGDQVTFFDIEKPACFGTGGYMP